MNRWKRPPPPHADPWRAWLAFRGSLTARIAARAPGFRVERIVQRMRLPNEDEHRALRRPGQRLVLVREVILHAGGAPVVLAHSIVARVHLCGVWRSLRGLGNRPLAAALFTDPLVRRHPLEFARLDRRHPLWKRARQVFGREFPALWARRSVFERRGRPLLVTEVFLPAILALAR